MASPSTNNFINNTSNILPSTFQLNESLFGSAWNNTWLPHPTRDVQSSLYPWTEDAARDFVLQTALALCCGARPSPSAASFNLSQLTPVNGQPAPLAPGQSPVAFYYASETPSMKQRQQEEGLLKMFLIELIESKNQQFQEQQKLEQEQQQDDAKNENTDTTNNDDSDKNSKEEKVLRQLPPKLSTKDICQALLPSAFWMNCNVLHPIAVSCAWRIAFAVELLDEQFQEAQELVRRELFSKNEYDWKSSIEVEKTESMTAVQQDDAESFSFLKTTEKNEDESQKEEDPLSSSTTPNSVWKSIYESALEDRSMAATHIRGIISRRLTLDRFSVRELHFVWQLFCGPRSTALKWFRKWSKNNNYSSLNVDVNTQSQTSASKGPSPSSTSLLVSPGGAANNNQLSLLFLPSNITLNSCPNCFPPHVSFLFTPLALHCVIKKDSLMFELRALYFGVLEQHGIGKERRVIGNNSNINNSESQNNVDVAASSSATKKENNSIVDAAEADKKNPDEVFVIPTTTAKTVKPGGKVSKTSTAKQQQLVSFADEQKQKKIVSEPNNVDDAAAQTTINKTAGKSKKDISSTVVLKNEAPSRRCRGGKGQQIVESSDSSSSDQDEAEEKVVVPAKNKTQLSMPRKKSMEDMMKTSSPTTNKNNVIPQITTAFGFLFNDIKNPLQPFVDSAQQQQNTNNNTNTNNQNSYSLRSQRIQQNINNIINDQNNNFETLLQNQHHQKPKPEMELSSWFEVNDQKNDSYSQLQQDEENNNQRILITQVVAPPLIDENNLKNNVVDSSSTSAAAAPRHSSAVWQLMNVSSESNRDQNKKSSNNNDTTPEIWKEYYSRCFDLIEKSGLKMKNKEYVNKVL